MTLDDTLWDLLDAIHLGNFFDTRGLPPILLPILIVAIVAGLFFVPPMLGGGPAQACNNDNICDSWENKTSCPNDCGTVAPPGTGKTIKVYISGGLTCNNLRVKLTESDGSVVEDKTGGARALTFQSVTAKQVYAEVSSPESAKPAESSSTISTDTTTTLRVELPEDYCTPTSPDTSYGSIKVVVVDKTSGQSLTADVSVYNSEDSLIETKTITEQGTFTSLKSNEFYYFTAMAAGHADYYGKDETILVATNQEKTKTIRMAKVAAPGSKGQLEVCVRGEDGPIETSGEVGIYNLANELINTRNLKDCPLFKGLSTGAGCVIFDLPIEEQFYVGLSRAPAGCTISARMGPYMITTEKRVVSLNVTCNNVGSIRAIVYGKNDTVMTDNCTTIDLFYNSKTDKSRITAMEVDSGGNYTEYKELPGGTMVKISVIPPTGSGYLPTVATDEIEAGKNITVSIDLDVPPVPLPNLTIVGMDLPKDVVKKLENLTATANSITLTSLESMTTVLTTGVTVTCQIDLGTTVTAVYNTSSGKWRCNLTAPNSVGTKTVLMRATKSGANGDTDNKDLIVINDLDKLLKVIPDTNAFTSELSGEETLYFNISYADAQNNWAPVLADKLRGSYIEAYFSGGLVANITAIAGVTGKSGYFSTTFYVPFAGDYTYKFFPKAIIGSDAYVGFNQGSFYAIAGAQGTFSCLAVPQITRPNGAVNVSASFELNNALLKGQNIQVQVMDGVNNPKTTLPWNESAGLYESEIPVSASECKYKLNCSAVADPRVSYSPSDLYVYAANPNAAGVNKGNCPTSVSTGCNSVERVRDCYNRSLVPPQTTQFYNDAVDCAKVGLLPCTGATPTYGTCNQSVKLRVRAKGITTNTTPFLYFRPEGNSTGKTTTLPYGTGTYAKPTVSGTGATTYDITEIVMPGGSSTTPGTTFSSIALVININATGDLTATAFCPLSCGSGLGDLDNSGGSPTTTDVNIMNTLLNAVSILGAPPYSLWPPTCADINGDGKITSGSNGDDACLGQMMNPPSGWTLNSCLKCTPPIALEVCNDGYDNNCDGQTDNETFNNAAGTFYGFTPPAPPEDLCACTQDTPCEMFYRTDSFSGQPTSESQAKRCSSISSLDNGKYHWYSPNERRCNDSKKTNTLTCNHITYSCDGSSWNLVGGGSGYPPGVTLHAPHNECDATTGSCNLVPTYSLGVDECPVLGGQWAQCKVVTQICGNGVREGTEQCDAGANPGTWVSPCSTTEVCNSICTCVASAQICGNGFREGTEQCDAGANPGTWVSPCSTTEVCNSICTCVAITSPITITWPTPTGNTFWTAGSPAAIQFTYAYTVTPPPTVKYQIYKSGVWRYTSTGTFPVAPSSGLNTITVDSEVTSTLEAGTNYTVKVYDSAATPSISGVSGKFTVQGAPVSSGCADGTREAFTSAADFPNIAGCSGTWTNTNLRATRSPTACTSNSCPVASDFCAPGWHLCMDKGYVLDLTSKTNADGCFNAGNGKWVAASDHCVGVCTYGLYGYYGPYGCSASGGCAQPVCCGLGCVEPDPLCDSGVWPTSTGVLGDSSHGCSNFPRSASGKYFTDGVLCCKDPPYPGASEFYRSYWTNGQYSRNFILSMAGGVGGVYSSSILGYAYKPKTGLTPCADYPGTLPLYEWGSPSSWHVNDHKYSLDPLASNGWPFLGFTACIYPTKVTGTTAIYCKYYYYDPGFTFLYTTSTTERDSWPWTDCGVIGWIYPPPTPLT